VQSGEPLLLSTRQHSKDFHTRIFPHVLCATQAKFPLWAAADLSFWTCLGRSRHKTMLLAAKPQAASGLRLLLPCPA